MSERAPEAIFSVRVAQRIAASPEKIFSALLDPEMIRRWMFGPALREERILHIELDPRVGGKFSFLVERGGTEIDHVGEYLLISPPRFLAFTWSVAGPDAESSRVDIEIETRGEHSAVTLSHEMSAKWQSFADRILESWTKMLGVLAMQWESS